MRRLSYNAYQESINREFAISGPSRQFDPNPAFPVRLLISGDVIHMPWSSNNNGGDRNSGGPRGPWGQGPNPGGGGNRGQQPPDLEDLLKRGREQFGSLVPGGKAGYLLIGLIAITLWMFSGVYRVGAEQNGFVLRFGEHVSTTQPGLNWHLPYPIETVMLLNVTKQQEVVVGRSQQERLMLTGDQNIVDAGFKVQYLITDGAKYLFNVSDPEKVIKSTAESVIRELVGKSEFLVVTSTGRDQLQIDVKADMQNILDIYDMGVTLTGINLGKVNPHPDAVAAAIEVESARAERDKLKNEAEAYANKIVPEAEGKASRIIAEAEAFKQQTIAEAEGQAQRFISVYEEYRLAPDVTRQRIFLETMEEVLDGTDKIILDDKGDGVVPYLPINELKKSN
ncbi:MAG: FtsH protease activity modulator HflK [Alphaproteobacteria bacterium]|nr:MAG: FtsH protease activity modulator HflK [Alphaproteobacteria bacterium]